MEIDDRLISFFENICGSDFWEYISDKVLVLPNDSDTCFYGCFPIVYDDILMDIRVSVPEIHNLKDLLINVHEFAHAVELYYELGTFYIDDVDLREATAKNMERKFTAVLSKKNI
ncbi:MAG: hypothetical protein IKJ43_01290 [Bacilli bacterium]|nr:hypothetical protein [Bacilli bacterium]